MQKCLCFININTCMVRLSCCAFLGVFIEFEVVIDYSIGLYVNALFRRILARIPLPVFGFNGIHTIANPSWNEILCKFVYK